MVTPTFIVDCPFCRAKVAATQNGSATSSRHCEETGEHDSTTLYVGKCPRCSNVLAGYQYQIDFEGYGSYEDRWSEIIRVYPDPQKRFTSHNIPKVVENSLEEAGRCMQMECYTAACAMIGRAIEGVCRHQLHPEDFRPVPPDRPLPTKTQVMLAEGLKKLKEQKIIDDRIHEWGTQLHAFRNLAAHPADFVIDREDAEDLYNFANAMVEYIYDLAERYAEFKARQAKKKPS